MTRKNRIKEMKMGLLYLLVLFITEIYYTSVALWNLNYSSSLYRGLCLLIAVIVICVYLFDIVKNGMCKYELLMILIISFIPVLSVLTISIFGEANSVAVNTIQNFIVRCVPAFLMGLHIAKKDGINLIIKWVDPLVIYLNVCIIKVILSESFITTVGRRVEFRGTNYQEFSYLCTLALGLNLFMLFYNKNSFKIFDNKLYKVIRYLYLFLQIFGIIYGTGRGAFVLMLVYICYAPYLLFVYHKLNPKTLIIFVASTMLGIGFFTVASNISQFQYGLNKSLSLMAPGGGINWGETSGRLPIYQTSIDRFVESPLFGHGVDSIFYLSHTGYYSHNIYLDLLVEGGLIYLLIFSYILIKTIYLLYKYVKKDIINNFVCICFLYSFVMLNFSGSYLKEACLWFTIAFVFMKNHIHKAYLARNNVNNFK